ncbi:TonB-dependent receptor [Sphingosinicella sp.]|uniref:TonB-dependent receptor n=1 Tax=Sphingosinicella sp. TaxID=1917971 RepID=UPI004037F47D
MIRPASLLFALLIPPTAAQAQAGETIVVTGRGLRPGLGESAYSAVAIDRDRLAGSAASRLEDVLRDVPGFQLFRRADSRSANPTSQGPTLRALGGNASARVLVLLDGVPQADPFGGWIAWPSLDPRRLGAARVTRGGGTGANGPGALAGTIALDSLSPAELDGVAARAAIGSRDSVDAFAAVGVGGLVATASVARGDGFIPIVADQRGPADRPAPYRQASLALRAVASVAPNLELQANLAGFTDRRERGTAFSEIRSQGADASLRLAGRGALPFAALLYVQQRDFSNQFASLSAGRATAGLVLDQYATPATGLGARFEIRPLTGPVELRLGADWRAVEGRAQELFQFVAGAPTRLRRAGGRSDTLGGFAELGLERGPLTVSAGARLDHWRIADGRLEERPLAGGPALTDTRFPDRSGWQPTGRLGAAWRADALLTLRAAAYAGWRLPTLNELYRPFRVGVDATAANAALAPERSLGAEAGLDWRPLRGLRLGATAFVNRLTDAIANVTLGQGPGTFPGVGFVPAGGAYRQRRNLRAISSHGVELDAALDLGAWRLAAGYSFAAARVRAEAEAAPLDGLRPAQTPRHAASFTLLWRGPSGASASLAARYAGAQYEDDLNRQLIPDALTLDAAATLPIADRLAVEARVENLTDTLIVTAISGAVLVERAAPRTFWLGLSWRG